MQYDWNTAIKYEDEQVEKLLDSLGMDCMGGTLIRSLDGVTILTGQDGNYYDHTNKTIHLQNHDKYGYRDYVLLEELIHCYQYQECASSGRRFPTLNDEIEAKVGWLVYIDGQLEYDYIVSGKTQLGNDADALYMMADLLSFGANPSGAEFSELYFRSKESLQSLRKKSEHFPFVEPCYPQDKYPFVEDYTFGRFENLYKLMKDC